MLLESSLDSTLLIYSLEIFIRGFSLSNTIC